MVFYTERINKMIKKIAVKQIKTDVITSIAYKTGYKRVKVVFIW